MKMTHQAISFGHFPCRLFIGFAIIFSLALRSARGDLIFADSFAYSKGDLVGQGPPPGSPPGQGGWTFAKGTPMVALVGLEFAGIFSAGHKASVLGLASDNGDKALAALGPVTANDGLLCNRRPARPSGRAGAWIQ